MTEQNLRMKVKILAAQVKGHHGLIAKKTGHSLSTVSKVLAGEYVNMEVINAAIEVRDQIEKELKELASKI